MSYFREVDLGASFPPFAVFREQLGFVPNLFRAQSLAPRLIEAEAGLLDAILFKDLALSRVQKEYILLRVAEAHGNVYCATRARQMLELLGAGEEQGPLSSDESKLEAVLTTALGNLLCTLSTGVGATPEFEPVALAEVAQEELVDAAAGPYLRAPDRSPDDFLPFAFFRNQFGFVPSLFRAQTLRPDAIEAQAEAIRAVLLNDSLLTRPQKESILLCKVSSSEDSALMDFTDKLATEPAAFGRKDIQSLHDQGFSDEQIIEAVVTTALASFLDTLEFRLGVSPDFAARRQFRPAREKKAHLSESSDRLTDGKPQLDPDADRVEKAQRGDLDAFEELINRHSRRVYRTLVGILGNPDEARDAMQDTFIKAFQHLGGFERRSKFSTWLMSIASNTAVQLLRQRKRLESIDDDADADEHFRPRQIQSWTDDPEQLYSKTEMRSLIESEVMKLPMKYRVVLMLRDIEQLPAEDAAAALGLGIPALKARLLRGRLMLRETLSPHFANTAKGVTS